VKEFVREGQAIEVSIAATGSKSLSQDVLEEEFDDQLAAWKEKLAINGVIVAEVGPPPGATVLTREVIRAWNTDGELVFLQTTYWLVTDIAPWSPMIASDPFKTDLVATPTILLTAIIVLIGVIWVSETLVILSTKGERVFTGEGAEALRKDVKDISGLAVTALVLVIGSIFLLKN
jgi:hypothetical protein